MIELTAGYGSTDVYHLVWARDTVMQVLILYMDFIRQHNLQQYVVSLPVLSELINTYSCRSKSAASAALSTCTLITTASLWSTTT